MANDTVIASACLFCLLLLNTFTFFYNQEPITTVEFNASEVSVSQFESGINESGLGQSSSGLRAVLGIGKFFLNLAILLFGWYFSFPVVINFILKLATYIFAIPLFITIVRLIRGV